MKTATDFPARFWTWDGQNHLKLGASCKTCFSTLAVARKD